MIEEYNDVLGTNNTNIELTNQTKFINNGVVLSNKTFDDLRESLAKCLW